MNWKDYANILGAAFGFVVMLVVANTNGNISEIKGNVTEIKGQLFTHLTNHELHTPRTVVEEQLKDKVSTEQFVIYQTMRDRQMTDIKESLARLEMKIDEHMKDRELGR